MTWLAEYCVGSGSLSHGEIFNTEAETLEDVERWVRTLEAEKKIEPSIYSHSFRIDEENFKQWGTDYWWLSVRIK